MPRIKLTTDFHVWEETFAESSKRALPVTWLWASSFLGLSIPICKNKETHPQQQDTAKADVKTCEYQL